jgi:hypothetical protein
MRVSLCRLIGQRSINERSVWRLRSSNQLSVRYYEDMSFFKIIQRLTLLELGEFGVLMVYVGVVVAVSVHAVWPAAAPFCSRFMSQTKLWLAGAVVAVLMFGAGIFWTLQTVSIR